MVERTGGTDRGHLASLRRMLQNIDSTIPFLTVSDDAEAEGTVDPDALPEEVAPDGMITPRERAPRR